MKIKNTWPLIGIVVFMLLFMSSAIIFRIYKIELLPSQFYGALISVVITAIITGFLLRGQSAKELERDKSAKIFEEKVRVYSEFTEKMWGMLAQVGYDDEESSDKLNQNLKELRMLCFSKLVFYLNDHQVKEVTDQLNEISGETPDTLFGSVERITHILQRGVDVDVEGGQLRKLYNSFSKKEKEPASTESSSSGAMQGNAQASATRGYWHFNILDDKKQIEAFRKGNWVLALTEYGERWRTNLVQQVKPNDVIFLFKRGGPGYIGAFVAKDPTSITLEADKPYGSSDLEKYDIYDGLKDGASLCSNILVEPIAFNFKGVRYRVARPRTIERMNDTENVKFLLNRFNGQDLTEEQKKGKDRLDETTPLKEELDRDQFDQVVRENNLS